MKEHIKNKLVSELSYSLSSASKTAEQLCNLKDLDLKNGLLGWLQLNTMTLISEGAFSTDSLMKTYHMTYPATLIFLDWYREDPKAAMSVLKIRM